jgi:putative ABC transport system substrate-binding protein
MFNPDTSLQSKFLVPVIEGAAPTLGVKAIVAPVRAVAEIEFTLAGFAQEPNIGLVLPTDSFTLAHQRLIADLASRYRMPSIGHTRFANDGGLIEYGISTDYVGHFHEAASYVDRILKRSRPGDLPVQAPIKYRLVINVKTAKALGLTVPPNLLALADEVIE